MFDRLAARLDQLLRRAVRPDARSATRSAARIEAIARRTALIEAKAALRALRGALADTERELETERRQLADAERRGRLAAEVPDSATVAVAERFAARYRERVALLERKVTVQREEVALAGREIEELLDQHRAAPAARPGLDLDAEAESLAAQADQKLRDQAVDAQLAYLKRKMGKRT